MKANRFAITAAALVIALAASGCGHRLVVKEGEKTVKVYESEDVYHAAIDIKHAVNSKGPIPAPQRNFIRMLDQMVEAGELKNCDDGAKVKIISTDADGSMVELLEGPDKGYQGFVPKENLK